MDWIALISLVVNFLFFLLLVFYQNYCKKMVDIYAAREESFEKERGKLDATRDAIDNILKELEQMKSSVSFEEQRKHEFVVERNKRLMNILRYSEQVNISKQVLCTAINNESMDSMKDLQKTLNDTILNLRSDLMYLIVFYENIGKDDSVSVFGDKIFFLACEVSVKLSNAISLVETKQKQMEYAMSLPDGALKCELMNSALQNKNKLIEMKNDTAYKGHEGYEEAVRKYLGFLMELYKSDVFLKYNFTN